MTINASLEGNSVGGALTQFTENCNLTSPTEKLIRKAEMKLVFVALFTVSALNSLSAFGFSFDAGVPLRIQAQFKNDIEFMSHIEGANASPLHKEIFGELSGKVYKTWWESRIKSVGVASNLNPKMVAAVNTAVDSTKMLLTPNYINLDAPQIGRLQTIIHEARHTESENFFWMHALCPTPFLDKDGQDMRSILTGATLAGEPACDTTSKGAYGSSVIILKNISLYCSNCSAKVKMDAALYADEQLKRITDKVALQEIQTDCY